jgi:hypothetical protein
MSPDSAKPATAEFASEHHVTMAYIRSLTQEPPGSIGIAREDPDTCPGLQQSLSNQ